MAPKKRPSEGEGTPKAKKQKPTTSLTKVKFVKEAGTLSCKVDQNEFELHPKLHGTGSVGWSLSKRLPMTWADTLLLTQVSLNCTAMGSKEWPEGDGTMPEAPEVEAAKNTDKCKTPEKISRAQFYNKAKVLDLELGETLKAQMKPKLYDNGGSGWFFSGRLKPVVAGEQVTCMVTLNATVANSNKWPQNDAEEADEDEEEDDEEDEDEVDDEDGEGEEAEADKPTATEEETKKGAAGGKNKGAKKGAVKDEDKKMKDVSKGKKAEEEEDEDDEDDDGDDCDEDGGDDDDDDEDDDDENADGDDDDDQGDDEEEQKEN